jgi:hypothetical protein
VSASPAGGPAGQEPIKQQLVPQQQAVVEQAQPAPPPSPPPPPVDPAVEIGEVIAAYARALESRDIARLQRAYPGMTTAQRRAFEDFFRETRSLAVTLAVSSLHVDGLGAHAQLGGRYEFVTSSGASERRPASFQAVLRREQGTWRLMSVR